MLEITCPSCLSSNILEDREVARDIDCINCGATFFVEQVVVEEEVEELEEEKVFTKQINQAPENSSNHVVISTGFPPFEHKIIDTIFVIDTLSKKVFSSIDPSDLFENAKIQLRARAAKLGGDAVVNCLFDYRISSGHGIFGNTHDLEIFAYGTVAKKVKE